MSWPGSDNTKASTAVLPCLSNATVQPRLQSGCTQCCHVSMLQQCSHVSKVVTLNATMSRRCSNAATSPKYSSAATSWQCNHISTSQDRMVQGYKRRWSGGQPSSRPTPVDGSIELLVLQYCPILSCLILYFPTWLQPCFLALPHISPVHNINPIKGNYQKVVKSKDSLAHRVHDVSIVRQGWKDIAKGLHNDF